MFFRVEGSIVLYKIVYFYFYFFKKLKRIREYKKRTFHPSSLRPFERADNVVHTNDLFSLFKDVSNSILIINIWLQYPLNLFISYLYNLSFLIQFGKYRPFCRRKLSPHLYIKFLFEQVYATWSLEFVLLFSKMMADLMFSFTFLPNSHKPIFSCSYQAITLLNTLNCGANSSEDKISQHSSHSENYFLLIWEY